MNYAKIKSEEKFMENLSDALSYTEIRKGDSLLLHKNTHTFSISTPLKRNYKVGEQGYIEVMSSENLEIVLGLRETSYDGIIEANKVISWMDAQT